MSNTIAFTGFQTGGQVSIDDVTTAAWGGAAEPDESSIWDETQSAGTDVAINVTRSNHRVAPEGVFFNLVLTGFDTNTVGIGQYDASYQDKYVFWDYGEGYTFAAPTRVIDLDAADGGDRSNSRYSRGPIGSHVFRTSAIHTVRVAVLEPSSGKIGFGNIDISVGDPDSFYSGAATLFVDTNGAGGGYPNSPAGAANYDNITSALLALNSANTPRRVMLERDQNHVMTSDFTYRCPFSATGAGLRIEAREGSGAKPIISKGSSSTFPLILDEALRMTSTDPDTDNVFKGVSFQGSWDVQTGTGTKAGCIQFQGTLSAKYSVIDACDFSDWGLTLYATQVDGKAPDRTLFFNDIAITSWGDIGFLGGADSTLSFTGCGFVQDPLALQRQSTDSSTLGPIRIGSSRMTNIWGCDLFSATGWSSIGSTQAVQPGIRWNSSPTIVGSMLNMQSSVIESAWIPVMLAPQNPVTDRIVCNMMVEGNVVIAGFQAWTTIAVALGGGAFRNNLLMFVGEKDASSIGGNNQGIDGYIRFDGGRQASPLVEATPVGIYNNTLVNLTTRDGATIADDNIGMSAVTQENNLVHQPGNGSPYAGLSGTVAFSPRYEGYRPNTSTLYTNFASSGESVTLWKPQIGSPGSPASPALGAALNEPSSNIDFEGSLRPEPPSIGAFEAD